MKYNELTEAWRNEIRRVERLGATTPINSTRRFWKDQFHAYGWEVGFKLTVRFADGQTARVSLHDIGTDKNAAIANALRYLESSTIANHHPAARLLWDQLEAKDAIRKPYQARVSQWRQGWFKPAVSHSAEKLSNKFHAMRRAATEQQHRPSRKLCTSLATEVVNGRISYRDAISKIIAAGGRI